MATCLHLINTPSIAVAENHHLPWCIGRIYAVRPGSLGKSEHKKHQRLGSALFDIGVKVTFRNLKTNSGEPGRSSLKGNHGDLKVKDEPMTAVALTNYIALRGHKIGYAENLTFYSLRRRAATDLTRKIGHDTARLIMNHDPTSRVLEKYYLSLKDAMDVLGLDELDGHNGGHDLALHVLTDERFACLRRV
ncbi:hypothetical protein CEP53_012340 [Fusarium sp. AF-6]|nr:hypothetical protein CEP53_012340 [Fusarium sp. AF-6]